MKKTFSFIMLIVAISFVFLSCDTLLQDNSEVDARLDEIERVVLNDSEKPSLLLVGDSRVYLWPKEYFSDCWEVYNIGNGGTSSLYSAYAIAYQKEHFDTIIISVGVNDYASKISLQDSISNIDACIKHAKTKADNVYVTTVPGLIYTPKSYSYDLSFRASQLNSIIPSLANNNKVDLILLAELLNSGIYLKNEFEEDEIHYNASAYEAIYTLYNKCLK